MGNLLIIVVDVRLNKELIVIHEYSELIQALRNP